MGLSMGTCPSLQRFIGQNSNTKNRKGQAEAKLRSPKFMPLTNVSYGWKEANFLEFSCSSPEKIPRCWCPWCSHDDPFAHLSTHPKHITILHIILCKLQCHSARSLSVEERTKPYHWLQSVLYVPSGLWYWCQTVGSFYREKSATKLDTILNS